MSATPGKRLAAAARRFNRSPKLVEMVAAKPEEILVSDTTLAQLPADAAEAKKRRFRAKGAPKEVDAYAIRRSTSSSSSA
jgi:class 3 adenylate cyclase